VVGEVLVELVELARLMVALAEALLALAPQAAQEELVVPQVEDLADLVDFGWQFQARKMAELAHRVPFRVMVVVVAVGVLAQVLGLFTHLGVGVVVVVEEMQEIQEMREPLELQVQLETQELLEQQVQVLHQEIQEILEGLVLVEIQEMQAVRVQVLQEEVQEILEGQVLMEIQEMQAARVQVLHQEEVVVLVTLVGQAVLQTTLC
jgi:hypothetical protein